ncbi:hypothetical protein ABZ864_44210 [Streptomyces sp. NPDC047082]|uniref:hypothetical protein n=1 Tax=Streptomyces sp. NPDC047082 TaxID=3155259 RepID=UPI0033D279A9
MIHNITARDTAVLLALTSVLQGDCLIYNASFDVARPKHEPTLHYRQAGHPDLETRPWPGSARCGSRT